MHISYTHIYTHTQRFNNRACKRSLKAYTIHTNLPGNSSLVTLTPGVDPATRIGSVIGFIGGGNSRCSSSTSSAPFSFESCGVDVVVMLVVVVTIVVVGVAWIVDDSSALLCLEVVGNDGGCDLSLEPLDGNLNNLSRPLLFFVDEDGGNGGGGGGRSDVADLSTLLWLSLRNGGGNHLRLQFKN